MTTLITSLLPFLAAPFIYQVFKKNKNLTALLDGFIFVAISGLLLLHLFSSEIFQSNLIFLVLMLLGFLGPNMFERCLAPYSKTIHSSILFLGILGFLFHTAIDGAALAVNESTALPLQLAIILHRLPVALTVWWLVAPEFKARGGWFAIALACLATILGYSFGGELAHSHESFYIAMIQAFVTGSILHVVVFRFHLHDTQEDLVGISPKKSRINYEGIGSLVGVFLIAVFLFQPSFFEFHSDSEHHVNYTEFILRFDSLLLISAPALLLAYFLSALLVAFVPISSYAWLNRGSKFKQVTKGVVVGLPLPVCSCGILPFYQTLIQKGVAPGAAIAFLIATPELGLDALLISFPLLGIELTITRLLAAIVFAYVLALILRPKNNKIAEESSQEEKNKTLKEKLRHGFSYGFIELFEGTAPWIFIGILLAAVLAPILQGVSLEFPYGLDIIIFSIIGIFVYVCASGATPLVAVFVAEGLSPGAAIAFLLTGPATNISTFGILSSLHGRNFAIKFALFAILISIIIGYLINFFWGDFSFKALLTSEHQHFNLIQILSAYIVGVLFLVTIYRLGARKFFSHLFE